MGRELRRVPAEWEHPKREDGRYQAMYNKYYGDVMDDWVTNHKKWEDGTHPDLINEPDLKKIYPFYSMYYGNPPNVLYYQTVKHKPEELTHIQIYQTTSEGTPISPVFKADEFEKLCEYAAEHCTTFASFKASKEEWMSMLSNGLVCHTEGNITFL